jgi:hypothetical protein
MSITRLSTEILQKIYEYATITDVLHLSQTSKKNHNAYLGQKLPILRKAFYNSSYGPYPELVKLAISGEPSTMRKPLGTEIRRNATLHRVIHTRDIPAMTIHLIRRMVQYAKVAEKWTELYPQLRWRFDSNNRRLLRPHEQERLRKSIYQYWTYTNLFHDQVYCEFDPDPTLSRTTRPASHDDPRLRLLRTYSTIDLVRLSEFIDKMQQLVEIDLYPSNLTIQWRYGQSLPPKALAKLSWGERDEHIRLLDVIMKFTPADFLHLNLHTTAKQERFDYIVAKGKWFVNTPATWHNVICSIAYGERMAPGRISPTFPSAMRPLRVPYVHTSDRDVQYGIVDTCEEEDRPDFYARHVFANDAISDGEWVEEWYRPNYFSQDLWIEDEGDEEVGEQSSPEYTSDGSEEDED